MTRPTTMIGVLLCVASALPIAQGWGVQPPPPADASADGRDAPPPRAENDTGGRPAPGRERGVEVGRDRLEKAVQMRLEQIERERAQLQKVKEQLSEGALPRDVLRDFPLLHRLLERDRSGPGGEVGPGVRRGPEREPGPRPDGPPGRGDRRDMAPPPPPMEPFTEIDQLVRRPGDERLPPLDRDLSPEERTAVNEFLSAAMPGLAADLKRLSERDEPAAAERYRRVFPRLQRALELRERNPELYQLVLGGLTARRAMMDQARGLSRMDKEAPDFGAKRRELLDTVDHLLSVSQQVRQIIAAEKVKDRAALVERIADWAVQHERDPGERRNDDREGTDRPERRRERGEPRDGERAGGPDDGDEPPPPRR